MDSLTADEKPVIDYSIVKPFDAADVTDPSEILKEATTRIWCFFSYPLIGVALAFIKTLIWDDLPTDPGDNPVVYGALGIVNIVMWMMFCGYLFYRWRNPRKLHASLLNDVRRGVMVERHDTDTKLRVVGFTATNTWRDQWREVTPSIWRDTQIGQLIELPPSVS